MSIKSRGGGDGSSGGGDGTGGGPAIGTKPASTNQERFFRYVDECGGNGGGGGNGGDDDRERIMNVNTSVGRRLEVFTFADLRGNSCAVQNQNSSQPKGDIHTCT